MPAVSERQRKAMCAELSYRKRNKGKKKRFKSMTMAQLRDFCRKVKKK